MILDILRILGSWGNLFLNNLVPIAVISGTAVSIYTFGYKRPELILEVESPTGHRTQPSEDGDTQANFGLLLANVGNSSAEEVQLTITADAFKFSNSIDATDSITPDYEPPQAGMEIRSGRMTGFLGGGRRHDIFLENVVYEGDVQELGLGKAIFTDGNHDLKYQVCCKSHGPRTGRISFEVSDGDVNITKRKYPTHRRRLKTCIFGKVERTRTQKVENLDEDDVTFQYEVQVDSSKRES